MSFIPNTPAERNDYRHALRVALAAKIGEWVIITPDMLKRDSAYSAQGAFQGFDKLIKAGKLNFAVAKGEDDATGDKCVALKRLA